MFCSLYYFLCVFSGPKIAEDQAHSDSLSIFASSSNQILIKAPPVLQEAARPSRPSQVFIISATVDPLTHFIVPSYLIVPKTCHAILFGKGSYCVVECADGWGGLPEAWSCYPEKDGSCKY